jgi:hypothetical protein
MGIRLLLYTHIKWFMTHTTTAATTRCITDGRFWQRRHIRYVIGTTISTIGSTRKFLVISQPSSPCWDLLATAATLAAALTPS